MKFVKFINLKKTAVVLVTSAFLLSSWQPVLSVEKKDSFFFQMGKEDALNSFKKDTGGLKMDEVKKIPVVKEEGGKVNNPKKFISGQTEKKNYVEGEVLVKYRKNKINLETSSGRAAALNLF